MENNKSSFWSRRFDNIEDCEIFIKEAHWFLIAMAGLTFVFSILIQQFFTLLPDVIFMTLLALLLKKYQSRTVAIVIFLYSLLLSLITFGNKLNLSKNCQKYNKEYFNYSTFIGIDSDFCLNPLSLSKRILINS